MLEHEYICPHSMNGNSGASIDDIIDKVNEIAEKVNILLRTKNEEK
jgi:hypothetical protein